MTGIVLLLAPRRWGRPAGAWAGAIAVAGGYVLVHVQVVGWPELPPLYSHGWPLVFGVAAAALGLLQTLVRLPFRIRHPLRLVACVAVPWLLLDRAASNLEWSTAERWWRCGAIGFGAYAVWALMHVATERRRGVAGPLVLLLTAAGTVIALERAGTLTIARLAGALTATMGAALVVAILRRDQTLTGGALPVVVVLLLSFLTIGRYYAELPDESMALLGAAPLALWSARLPRLRDGPAWRTLLLAALGAAILAALAAWLAHEANPPYDPY